MQYINSVQKYLLPCNLDVREHIRKHSPQIKGFSLEKLLQIIHFIYMRRGFKRSDDENGYVRIGAETFAKVADDYLPYLKYLEETGILLCDYVARRKKLYPLNPKSYSYRFTEPYSISYQEFDAGTLSKSEKRRIAKRGIAIKAGKDTSSIPKKVKEKREKHQKVWDEYRFIRNLDLLEVDFEAAERCINTLKRQIDAEGTLSQSERERATFKLTSYLAALDQFRTLPSRKVSIDTFANRLHSPVTRLKKELRYFLTFKGETLWSNDVKNCQPFFLQLMLNPNFWKCGTKFTVDSTTKKGKRLLNDPFAIKYLGVKDINKFKGRLRKDLDAELIHPEYAHQLWELDDNEPGSPGISPPLSQEPSAVAPAELPAERSGVDSELPSLVPPDLASHQSGTEDRKGESEEGERSRKQGWREATAIALIQGSQDVAIGNQEVDDFRNNVANGRIYEKLVPALEQLIAEDSQCLAYLKAEHIKWNSDPAVRRKAAKALMIRAMFAPNRSGNPISQKAFTMLRNTYPVIHSFMRIVRSRDYKRMAKLLQRIETFVMLKACIKAINRQLKNVPIWTIHDSIITTARYKDEVRRIMEETIQDFVGRKPNIEQESWADYKPYEIDVLEAEPEEYLESIEHGSHEHSPNSD